MHENWAFEMVRAIAPQYKKGTRAEKTKILDEFCAITGFHRKYAIRLLRRPPRARPGKKRGRPPQHDHESVRALAAIWKAMHYPSARRLKAEIDQWLPWAKRHLRLKPKTVAYLREMSVRSIDRRLAPYREMNRRWPAEVQAELAAKRKQLSGDTEVSGSPARSRSIESRSQERRNDASGDAANEAKMLPGAAARGSATKSRRGRRPAERGADDATPTSSQKGSEMAIEIKPRKMKDALVIGVRGEMVVGKEHFELMKFVVKQMEEHKRIVVDLGRVTKIDSAGVGELVAVNVAVKEKGGQLHLANFEEKIGKVLQMALIHKIIPSFDTQKEAIEAFDD